MNSIDDGYFFSGAARGFAGSLGHQHLEILALEVLVMEYPELPPGHWDRMLIKALCSAFFTLWNSV